MGDAGTELSESGHFLGLNEGCLGFFQGLFPVPEFGGHLVDRLSQASDLVIGGGFEHDLEIPLTNIPGRFGEARQRPCETVGPDKTDHGGRQENSDGDKDQVVKQIFGGEVSRILGDLCADDEIPHFDPGESPDHLHIVYEIIKGCSQTGQTRQGTLIRNPTGRSVALNLFWVLVDQDFPVRCQDENIEDLRSAYHGNESVSPNEGLQDELGLYRRQICPFDNSHDRQCLAEGGV